MEDPSEIIQLLPKRLKFEVEKLINDKLAFNIVNISELNITFNMDEEYNYILSCKFPNNYPFTGPTLTIITNNINTQDLIIINKKLNNKIKDIWSPCIKCIDLGSITNDVIKEYNNIKITLNLIKNKEAKTLTDLSIKYPINLHVDCKYTDFNKQLHGLWYISTDTGYIIFFVEGNYININYEPINKDSPTLYYKGSYACGSYNNKFNIHIEDETDKYINNFIICTGDNNMTLMFVTLNFKSKLNTIITKLLKNDIIGESIYFIKLL